MKTIAVTGHRPNKLGGYDAEENFKAIRRHMRELLEGYHEEEIKLFSGGALGIDQLWMEVGLHLNLKVVAVLPFVGYDSKWPPGSRIKYKKLLDKCYNVMYVSKPGYDPAKLQLRNEWMVDYSDVLVAYFNGAPSGTQNCIDYAVTQKRVVHVFNPDEIIANANPSST